jgi:hypothetical protein
MNRFNETEPPTHSAHFPYVLTSVGYPFDKQLGKNIIPYFSGQKSVAIFASIPFLSKQHLDFSSFIPQYVVFVNKNFSPVIYELKVHRFFGFTN